MENFPQIRFDLSMAISEIWISSSQVNYFKADTPAIMHNLTILHNKNLISQKTLVGVIDEMFYR